MSKIHFRLNFDNGKYGIVTQKDKETAALELGWIKTKLQKYFDGDPYFIVREDSDNMLYVTFKPEIGSDKSLDIIRLELKGRDIWNVAILYRLYPEYTSCSRIFWNPQRKGLFNFYSYDFESHEIDAIIEKILSNNKYALFVREIFPDESKTKE